MHFSICCSLLLLYIFFSDLFFMSMISPRESFLIQGFRVFFINLMWACCILNCFSSTIGNVVSYVATTYCDDMLFFFFFLENKGRYWYLKKSLDVIKVKMSFHSYKLLFFLCWFIFNRWLTGYKTIFNHVYNRVKEREMK